MRKIFIGYLFILLDFNLTINSCIIGFIPDFVGYIYFIQGLEELLTQSKYFARAQPFALGMSMFTGILYVIDLLSITPFLGYFGVLLGTASLLISLYISYLIIKGILDIELTRTVDIHGKKLMSVFIITTIIQLSTHVLIYLTPAILIISILATLISYIVYLVVFNDTKKLYEALPRFNILMK